jgi:hypothetical protein
MGADALYVCVFGKNDVQMLAPPDTKSSAARQAQKVNLAAESVPNCIGVHINNSEAMF